MVKQLIVGAMPLLIQNALEAIQYAQIILNFIVFAQYILYNDKTLRYIDYALYKLEKGKIVFEHYDAKPC